MKLLKKIISILNGHYRYFFRHPEIEEIAKIRLEKCNSCHIMTNGWCSKFKGGCGCKVEKKVRDMSEDNNCPIDLW